MATTTTTQESTMSQKTDTRAVAFVLHPDGTTSHRNLKTTAEYGRHEVAFAVVETRRNALYADNLRSRFDEEAAKHFLFDNRADVDYSVGHWTKSLKSAEKWVRSQQCYVDMLGLNEALDYVIVHVDICEAGA
jgi:hypothetical protein